MKGKEQVKKILDELSKLDQKKLPLNKDGNMNMSKIIEVKEIKEAVKDLDALGIDSKWLFDNGFMAAGMVIGRLLKN